MAEYPGLDHIGSERFLAEAAGFADRWDMEWMRYFQLHDDTAYFVSYASHRVSVSDQQGHRPTI